MKYKLVNRCKLWWIVEEDKPDELLEFFGDEQFARSVVDALNFKAAHDELNK